MVGPRPWTGAVVAAQVKRISVMWPKRSSEADVTKKSEFLIAVSAAAVFGLLGLGMVVLGWRLHSEQRDLLAVGLETSGQIVRFERVGAPQEDALRESFLVPVVRFKTESGMQVEFLGTVAERFWTDHRAGSTVSVVYDPANPERAKINEYAEIWFAPVILFIVGLGAVVIPSFTLWRHCRS